VLDVILNRNKCLDSLKYNFIKEGNMTREENQKILNDFVVNNSDKVMKALAQELNFDVRELYKAFDKCDEVKQLVYKAIQKNMDSVLARQED